jgi:hypothetical protein
MRLWAYFLCGLMTMNVTSALAVGCDDSGKKVALETKALLLGDKRMVRSWTEKKGLVTIRWGADFLSWSRDNKTKMTHVAADADACLAGFARKIEFYSPKGELVGTASAVDGIRVIE